MRGFPDEMGARDAGVQGGEEGSGGVRRPWCEPC